jgi:hypothetical protein
MSELSTSSGRCLGHHPQDDVSTAPSPAPVSAIARRVLAGMVAKGHGTELLCLCLGLARTALLDLVVDLDLPTPHDRPLRKPGGRNPWFFSDTALFIVLWMAGWRAESLGVRFGRSRGSIWAKARQLGLPGRDRKLLFSPPPSDLAAAVRPTHRQASRPAGAQAPARSRAATKPDDAPAPAAAEGTESEVAPTQAQAQAPVPVAAQLASSLPKADTALDLFCFDHSGFDLPRPTPVGISPVRRSKRHEVVWTRERDVELAQRWWARQHYKAIARDMGLSPSTVQSRRFRVSLPTFLDLEDLFIFRREELVDHFDPSVVDVHIDAAGYVERHCKMYAKEGKRFWFWSKRRDWQFTSPEWDRLGKRKRNHQPILRVRQSPPALTFALHPF